MADAPTLDLTREEYRRYARHLTLPEVGVEGQGKLKSARVLCVGAGGLGSPVALYLAAAGVGTIGIIDDDVVEMSNLQRQIIHSTQAVGTPKVRSAAARIAGLNPDVRVIEHESRLTSANGMEIIGEYDLVVDGTDNFPTRYLVNDACVLLGKPFIYGSVFRFEGQSTVFDARRGPCYRCLFPEPPEPGSVPSCEEGGVLGVLPGIIGLVQATEAIKQVLGVGSPLVGRLLVVDALDMRFRELKLRKDPGCPACGDRRTVTALIDYEAFCGSRPAQAPPAAHASEPNEDVEPRALASRMARGERFQLLDVREDYELRICALPYTHWIPVDDLPKRFRELDPQEEVVVYCRSGARSDRAARFLRSHGFANARNLLGGVLRWSDDVDPALAKY